MNPNDIIVFAALDLPIEQFYDLMHWYLRDDPANVLHPSVQWVCEKRAREMSHMLDARQKAWEKVRKQP